MVLINVTEADPDCMVLVMRSALKAREEEADAAREACVQINDEIG